MTRRRLSDFSRVTLQGDGVKIETRSGTSRSDHFGDAQVVNVRGDEVRELQDFLQEHFGGEDGDQ